MAFPQTRRVIIAELFVNGGWVDISDDVYVRNPIVIKRGRPDGQSRAAPSSCQLTIDNRSGNYSPRNPMGLYYGSLGRNTPIRVNVGIARDTFTRITSSTWGTSDTGHTYTTEGVGSPVNATNWNTNGTRATLSIPVANGTRTSILNSVTLQEADAAAFFTLPFDTPTGASIMFFIQLRRQSVTDYVRAWAQVQTDGSVVTGVTHVDNTILVAQVTVPGLTFTSAAGLNLRAQVEGQTWRVKVWAGNGSEPYGWTIVGNSTYRMATGSAAISAWVRSGNTNTFPVLVSVDSMYVRAPRFSGEVSSWPQRWDLSGNDVFTSIDAASIKRRLGQGATATGSALYRFHKQLATPPIEYWPGEDAKNSNNALTATMGGAALSPGFSGGTLNLGGDTGFLPSAPLALSGNSATYNSTSNPYAGIVLQSFSVVGSVSTGQIMERFIIHLPPSSTSTPEPIDNFRISYLHLSGTVGYIQINYNTGGLLTFATKFDPLSGSDDFTTGPIGFRDIRGRPIMISLQLTQVGADITYDLSTLEPGQLINKAIWLHAAGTVTGKTLGTPLNTGGAHVVMAMNFDQTLLNYGLGHISLRSECLFFSDIANAFSGFNGEAAGTRIARLCSEDGVPFTWRGDLTITELMGIQGVGSTNSTTGQNIRLILPSTGQTLLDLLNECEDVDMGMLYEPRGDMALEYRTRTDLYSQTPSLTLDYSLKQVAPPLEPIDDDQRTANNVTVTRTNGLSAEAELLTGSLSTLDPSAGGVGNYQAQYTVNVASDDQLADIATFLLSLGADDEARYPSITVDFANHNFVAAGLESAALAVNIGDQIAITNPKTGVTADTISQIVQGYTETLSVFRHMITFNTSPETPYRLAQVSATPTYKVDSATSTLASGYSATAVSLSVNNVNEPWTTDPAQMPIPITVAGELMNVTAVSGASTPQTFTVTRSVNGVAKTQLAGATIQIARSRRPIIAF